MCKICKSETLPMQLEVEHKPKLKNKNKSNSKQCFTCNNVVPKYNYKNKHLLYNGIKHSLCEKCSNISINIPVKDKSLIEFQDCSICNKQVKYESIFCDLCQHLVHPYCNGIDKKQLGELGESEDKWYCISCNLKIYPHYLLHNDSNPKKKIDKLKTKQEFITFKDCSVCSKNVSGSETISCSMCKHWVHKKCIGQFKNRAEFQDFLHYYSNKPWDCPTCTAEMLPFIFLDNDKFYMLLLDIFTKPTYLNKDNIETTYIRLKEMQFYNVKDETDNNNKNTDKYLDNIDPDLQYLCNDTCDYTYNTEDIKTNSSEGLTMMTFNIRSIKKNFDNFVNLLSKLNSKIHIVCLTETWLTELDNTNDFKLDGYHIPLVQNRPNNQCGGVMTYIHQDINTHKLVKNMSFCDDFNHCLSTEIQINNKKTTILNIYRSPSNSNETFLKKLETIIEKTKSKPCYILGDLNYNLINIDKHAPTNEYYNMLTAASFKPLITKPTRITDRNETLIDHIWTNNLQNTIMNKSYIILTDITDHLPCINVVKHPDFRIKGYKHITKRMVNQNNREKFTKEINKIKHILAFQATNKSEPNLETRYNNYFDQITTVYNKCFPLITKKVHSKILSKPWITTEIKKLIDKKNKYFSIKNKHKTDKNQQNYKTAKKKVETAINAEKKMYFHKILVNTNNNIKQKWDAIRLMINRQKTDQNSCNIPSKILGQHYATIANKLAEKLPKLSKDDIPTTSNIKYSNRTKNKFQFNETSEREVYELILKLDSTKGPGTDNIDTKSLKSIANVIASHLASLFNDSMSTGTYPQCLKIAKCIPIYKGTPLDASEPVNYRPISILTSINKVFERIIHNQISKYAEINKLLPKFQYGYRKQHNTSQAILNYTEYITTATANKLITISIFMDLSKAFDTVDKTILKDKLSQLGMTDLTTSLIDSYMSNRKFCINNDKTYYTHTYGVPQGSILGPLLFILYTYDMTDITNNKTIVYADDTTVLVSGRNLTETKQHCNDILNRFYQYFTLNKLSINPLKTKYMIHKPVYRKNNKKLLQDMTNTDLIMDGTPLKQVKSIKFLGVVINDRLAWDDHKQLIYTKICKTLGIIYNCKNILNEEENTKMYKTFIQPYFLYGIEVWGHSIKSDNDILVKLQSKVLRILFNCFRTADAWRHSNGTVNDIRDLYKNVIKKQCMKHHFGLLPSNFRKNTMPSINYTQLDNRISRISLNLMYDYKIFKKDYTSDFKMNCTQLWNSLPFDIKSMPYLSGKENIHRALKLVI